MWYIHPSPVILNVCTYLYFIQKRDSQKTPVRPNLVSFYAVSACSVLPLGSSFCWIIQYYIFHCWNFHLCFCKVVTWTAMILVSLFLSGEVILFSYLLVMPTIPIISLVSSSVKTFFSRHLPLGFPNFIEDSCQWLLQSSSGI